MLLAAEPARRAVESVAGVDRVDVHGRELSIAVSNGAASISPVAVALDGCDVSVRELTLRTPTLDDVFLEFTGERIVDVGADDSATLDEPRVTDDLYEVVSS